MFEGRRKAILKISIGVLISAAVITVAVLFWNKHTVEIADVAYEEGYGYYSDDEIRELVEQGPFGKNTLYLGWKYREEGLKGVPLVDVINVEVLEQNAIKITVYGKKIAGYIRFMDAYMYIDKDGYVAENSSKKIVDVPQITGLSFEHAVLGDVLPVEDKRIFSKIYDITKLLSKYELSADKIFVQGTDSITLVFDQVKVILGSTGDSVEGSIGLLPKFLPELEGKSGILQMDKPKSSDGRYVFTPEE